MNFKFTYLNSPTLRYGRIERVEYVANGSNVVVSGDELSAHSFPVDCDMHLFSDGESIAVSHKGLQEIRASKGKD